MATTVQLSDSLIATLIAMANRDTPIDDADDGCVCADDWAGGNIDDAFSIGESQGEALLARQVLDAVGISWVTDPDT